MDKQKIRDRAVKALLEHEAEGEDTAAADALVEATGTAVKDAQLALAEAQREHNLALAERKTESRRKDRGSARFLQDIRVNVSPTVTDCLTNLQTSYQKTRNITGRDPESLKACLAYHVDAIREIQNGGLDRLTWEEAEARALELVENIPVVRLRRESQAA